jgi:hypothetical protein
VEKANYILPYGNVFRVAAKPEETRNLFLKSVSMIQTSGKQNLLGSKS